MRWAHVLERLRPGRSWLQRQAGGRLVLHLGSPHHESIEATLLDVTPTHLRLAEVVYLDRHGEQEDSLWLERERVDVAQTVDEE